MAPLIDKVGTPLSYNDRVKKELMPLLCEEIAGVRRAVIKPYVRYDVETDSDLPDRSYRSNILFQYDPDSDGTGAGNRAWRLIIEDTIYRGSIA